MISESSTTHDNTQQVKVTPEMTSEASAMCDDTQAAASHASKTQVPTPDGTLHAESDAAEMQGSENSVPVEQDDARGKPDEQDTKSQKNANYRPLSAYLDHIPLAAFRDTIDSLFQFKKRAMGVSDIGYSYFSQATAIIDYCCQINCKDSPKLADRRIE